MTNYPDNWRTTRLTTFLKKVRRPVAVEPQTLYRQIGVRSFGKGIFHKEPVTGEDLGGKGVFWVRPGDFVLNIVFAWEGAVALISEAEEGMCASHRFPTFIIDDTICDPAFLLLYFKTKKGVEQLALASPGGAGRNRTLNQSDFLNLIIALPPLPEQRKMATILATCADAVGMAERLVTILEIRQRELKCRLLTGKFRFPGLDGTWEENNFSDLLDVEIGATPSRANPDYWDTQKITSNRWLSIADLSSKYIRDSKEYLSDCGVKKSSTRLFPEGTVVMSFKLTIGRAAILVKPCYTNEAICALIPRNTAVLSREYLYHSLSIVDFEQEIDQAVKGRTLNKAKLKRLQLRRPPQAEQKALASFFDLVDTEISVLRKYKAQLQIQKQGLMQRLLTGQVRVRVDEEEE